MFLIDPFAVPSCFTPIVQHASGGLEAMMVAVMGVMLDAMLLLDFRTPDVLRSQSGEKVDDSQTLRDRQLFALLLMLALIRCCETGRRGDRARFLLRSTKLQIATRQLGSSILAYLHLSMKIITNLAL